MYLLRGRVAMLWPYDERCRLLGENVWEYDDTEHELIKLEPDEILTTERAAELLAPQIQPLAPIRRPPPARPALTATHDPLQQSGP